MFFGNFDDTSSDNATFKLGKIGQNLKIKFLSIRYVFLCGIKFFNILKLRADLKVLIDKKTKKYFIYYRQINHWWQKRFQSHFSQINFFTVLVSS